MLGFLRDVLTEGQSRRDRPAFHVNGFAWPASPTTPPRIVLGALGPRMQELAAAEADGMIAALVGVEDIAGIRGHLDGVPRNVAGPLELSAGVFVIPPVGPGGLRT